MTWNMKQSVIILALLLCGVYVVTWRRPADVAEVSVKPSDGASPVLSESLVPVENRVLSLREFKCQDSSRCGHYKVVPGGQVGRSHDVGQIKLSQDQSAAIIWQMPVRTKGVPTLVNLNVYRNLRFDIFAPASRSRMHMAAFFIDQDDFWFQTRRKFVPRHSRWTKVEVDLQLEAGHLESRGHYRPWEPYVASNIKQIGIAVFTDAKTACGVYVDNVTLVPSTGRIDESPPQRIMNFEANAREIGKSEKFEITFELARVYDNPFDPSQVEVWGHFTGPDGELVRVPGFFYQGYVRTRDEEIERLIAVGAPAWKIRFAPRKIGVYAYHVEVFDGERFETHPATFVSVPSDDPGLVRVCEDDRNYFEFDDGSFYFPIGHNIPATFNVKAAQKLGLKVKPLEGTYAYDRYLNGMARGKENFARIWLASWSFGLEWTRAYHPSYRDLGRYNLMNAWRLDYVMEEAALRGIYMQIALTTFGHWRAEKFEGDWRFSPYSKVNGGFLKHPRQFWSDERSKKIYDNMIRYVMARYGYASNIAAWELCNEADLVTDYKARKPQILAWHRRIAKVIRQFDQQPHLITTNFAIWDHEQSILSMPEISFSSTNHYHVKIIDRMRQAIYPNKKRFHKPAIMAECGYDFKGAKPDTTERYLHICLWGSYMMPFAGTGLSWWWDFIDDRDLYHMFRPVAEFAEGEDRRGRNLRMSDGTLYTSTGQTIGALKGITLQNDRSAYFWVYEGRLLRAESASDLYPEARKGVFIQLRRLKDGPYRVEFWDTHKGGLIKVLSATAESGILKCALPTFASDIAGKVKPVSPDTLDAVSKPAMTPEG